MQNKQIISKRLEDLKDVDVIYVPIEEAIEKGLMKNSASLRCMSSNADIICKGELIGEYFIVRHLIVNENNINILERNPQDKLIRFLDDIIKNNKKFMCKNN